MSLLKTEPSASVKSLEDLFAIAVAMEEEAITRYADIADRMRKEGNTSLAKVFECLSADEQGHLDRVIQWSQTAKGQRPDPAKIRWQLSETFDDEGVATSDPQLLSAYRVLSMAVRNEERAFAFWSYVAAHAATNEVREAAEAMAHEELGHVTILRRERRKAFHDERAHAHADSNEDSDRNDLAALERRLAGLLEGLAVRAPDSEHMRIKELAKEARRHADELDQSPIPTQAARPVRRVPDDAMVLAEFLAERYLEAGDTLRDEEKLGRVQELAGRAIARLAWLRSDLPELQQT